MGEKDKVNKYECCEEGGKDGRGRKMIIRLETKRRKGGRRRKARTMNRL
jgi:hypothetical protein